MRLHRLFWQIWFAIRKYDLRTQKLERDSGSAADGRDMSDNNFHSSNTRHTEHYVSDFHESYTIKVGRVRILRCGEFEEDWLRFGIRGWFMLDRWVLQNAWARFSRCVRLTFDLMELGAPPKLIRDLVHQRWHSNRYH